MGNIISKRARDGEDYEHAALVNGDAHASYPCREAACMRKPYEIQLTAAAANRPAAVGQRCWDAEGALAAYADGI